MAGFQNQQNPIKLTLLNLRDGGHGWLQDYNHDQVHLYFDDTQTYLWVNIEELTESSFQNLKSWSVYTY